MFYPGATEIHRFKIPMPATDIGSVLVSYRQRGTLVIEKESERIEAVDNESCRAYIEMTEEETLKFEDWVDISAQVNVKSAEGGRIASKPLTVKCGPQFHRAVM